MITSRKGVCLCVTLYVLYNTQVCSPHHTTITLIDDTWTTQYSYLPSRRCKPLATQTNQSSKNYLLSVFTWVLVCVCMWSAPIEHSNERKLPSQMITPVDVARTTIITQSASRNLPQQLITLCLRSTQPQIPSSRPIQTHRINLQIHHKDRIPQQWMALINLSERPRRLRLHGRN